MEQKKGIKNLIQERIDQQEKELTAKYIKAKGGEARSHDHTWWFRITRRRWFNEWVGLNPTQRVVLLSLWLYAGKKEICYPSQYKLEKDLDLSRLTILRNIKILEKKGYIKIDKKVGRFNTYILLK